MKHFILYKRYSFVYDYDEDLTKYNYERVFTQEKYNNYIEIDHSGKIWGDK